MRLPRRTLAATLAARFAAALSSAGVRPGSHRLAIAFSGGPDSAATGALAAWWAGVARPPPAVAAALAAAAAKRLPDVALPRPPLVDIARAALGLAPPPEVSSLPPPPLPTTAPPRRPLAIVVDHGLRGTASAMEAEAAAALATRLGLEPLVVRAAWADGGSNPASAPPVRPARPAAGAATSAPARAARYAALASAARQHGAAALVTGHTSDDQAETVLLRLGRASGVDGLAGMRGVGWAPGGGSSSLQHPPLLLVRPVLGAPKAALLALCDRAGLAWVGDPTNADPAAGGRNAVRAALSGVPAAAAAACGRGGVRRRPHPAEVAAARTAAADALRLAALCGSAREAGEAGAAALLREAGAGPGSDGRRRPTLSLAPLAAAPRPLAARAWAAALAAVSGQAHPPPTAAVDRVMAAVGPDGTWAGGRGVSAGGCIVRPAAGARGGRVTLEAER